MNTRIRITWNDGSTTIINDIEATIYDTGLVRVTRDVGVRYVSPFSYKFVDMET